ncbi:MAG TPA: hypothetical protein VIY53_10485 [Acidobacteriaceae bacterium]
MGALTLPASGARPAATENVPYSGAILASGGSGSGYLFTVNGVSIPTTGTPVLIANGISVSSTGTTALTISGTPTAVGTVTLANVTVKDSASNTAGPDTYTIAVLAGYAVTGQIIHNNYCGGTLPLPPITLSINTHPAQTTTSGSNGSYTFASVPNGTYTITPSISGPNSAFFPATQTGVAVNNASVTVKNIGVALGYTVSGTVTYSGTKLGRIYVSLQNNTCGTSVGASIAAPGSFTIRGAVPGAYTATAWRDNRGYGVRNASNPVSAASTFAVSEANISGLTVALGDPAAVTLTTAPAVDVVSGFNGGAVVQFSPVLVNGVESATLYTVQWSTSKTFATVSGNKPFTAAGDHPWIVTGIANGSGYYFRARALAGSSTSPWSTPVGPVTIGAPTGSCTLSGTVTFSQTATGPLYVGVFDQNTDEVYAAVVGSKTSPPTSPASYTVQVPSGSQYFFFALLDQNNDGLIDPNDITNVNGYNMITPTLEISGNTIHNFTLPAGNSIAVVRSGNDLERSEYGGASHTYELDFDVTGMAKQPVAVTVLSGPDIALPLDAPWCLGCGYDPSSSFSFYSTISSSVPKVGATYPIQITYSDGTQETLSPTITAVVPTPTGVSPQGPVAATTTKPTLKWTYPATPGNYLYQIWFADQNYATVWSIPAINSSTNTFTSSIAPSISWGIDPTGATGNAPSLSALTDGNVYHWEVVAYDANGNRGQDFVDYVPGFKTLSLPPANPVSLGTAYVGQTYNGNISATGGYGGYAYAIGGLYNCYGCTGISLGNGLTVTSAQNTLTIGGTPTTRGAVSFEVFVRDASSDSPVGPVTYTVTITDMPVSLPAAASNPFGVPAAGVPYGGSITASGGLGGATYSFTVNGVSIPTSSTWVSVAGADGLTFANSGDDTLLVGGTPAASGTFPIDVAVTDTAESSNTASVTYSVVVNGGPTGANNGNVKGTYVCSMNGFNDSGGTAWAALSTVVLDGNGNVTSGNFDKIPSNAAAAVRGNISGTYSIGADNNGVTTIKSVLTAGGTGSETNTWMIALTIAGEPASPAQEFSMIEADDVGATPSGSTGTARCYLANSAAFVLGTISSHAFAFAQQGVNSSGIPEDYVGRFTTSAASGSGTSATGTISSGYQDGMTLDQTGDSGGAFTGSYTGPGVTGRFTVTIAPAGTTTTYKDAAYIVDADRIFMLEISAGGGARSGEMRAQQQSTYSNASFDGAAVLSGQAFEYSGGAVSGYDSSIYRVSGNGAGTLTVNQSYDDNGGTYTAGKENNATLGVTFDSSSSGRATFSPGSDSAFLYFYDANSAFYLDLNGGGNPNYLETGLLAPQTQSTFTDAALAGTYMESDLALAPGNNTVGEGSLSSTGAATVEFSKAGQDFSIFDQPGSGLTYSWLTTTYGAFTLNGSTCVVVTPASAVCMNDTSSSAKISNLQE